MLRGLNPQLSNAELTAATKSAVQALIAGAKNAKERQQKPGPRQTLAGFEVLWEASGLPESRRAARQEIPGVPLPAGHCREQVRR